MNKQNVMITIKGCYNVSTDKSTSELYTRGKMYRTGGNTIISYVETETSGYEGCTTTLKVEDDDCRVTLIRTGPTASHLVLQKGMRNIGSYDVFGNSLEIGVTTHNLDCCMTKKGGKLRMRYTLDLNTLLLSENELSIEIEQQ